MNRPIHYIREHFSVIYRGLLFVISVVAIVYLFPGHAQFQYDYQKGKPWMHESLIAPYNFPVYKSETQIQAEKDSILKDIKPYFHRREGIRKEEIKEFEQIFHQEWKQFLHHSFDEDSLDALPFPLKKKLLHTRQAYKNYMIDQLNDLYDQGIIESADINDKHLLDGDSLSTVYVSTGNDRSKFELDRVITHKHAYRYIRAAVDQFRDSLSEKYSEEITAFMKRVDYNQLLKANLEYDQEVTQKVKENQLSNLSLTKGMVQKGQRIISKGDVVNDKQYRILQSLKHHYQDSAQDSNVLVLIGQFIFVFVSVLMLFLFLWNFRREILHNSLKTTFILFLFLFFIAISSLVIRSDDVSLYIVPFALLPIIIRTFYDARLALFIHIVAIFVVGFNAPDSFDFVFLNFTAGIVAIFTLSNLYRRGKLFLASALVFLTYSVVYLGIAMINQAEIMNIEWKHYLWFGINGLLLLTSFPLIYIFEKLFGFLSDATLIELSDTNQPLLRQMAEKAPGTFQHSMQVANLAEEAVRHIGGNPLLVRAGALYHDIGKMEKPGYFIENLESEKNPHDNLDFDESANIIINHVTKGITKAQKNKLPAPIIDFIRTHHGTTTVQYFYKSYIKKYPEREAEIDKFRYPGPTPFSQETAVLMMADAVEAASRSFKNVSGQSFNKLVEDIVEDQVKNNQFNDSNITFRDISVIKGILKMKLRKIYHGRISYPQ